MVSNPSVVKEWLAKLGWFDVNSRMASSAYAPFAPYVPNTVEQMNVSVWYLSVVRRCACEKRGEEEADLRESRLCS